MSRQQVQFPVQQRHITTPPVPPAGSLKLYPKADNILYKLTSAGVESAVGVVPDPLTIGRLNIGDATKYIIPVPALPALSLRADDGYVRNEGKLGIGLSTNAYNTGTDWQRWDTAQMSHSWNIGGGLSYYNAPAGTGPVTAWTQRFSIGTDGAVTAQGNITGRWLYTNDGSNGVVQAGAGSLYLRSASGAYVIDSGGNFGISGPMSSYRATHRIATGGIGATAGSEGQLEINNAGSGASKIAFHREGVYAAYFGLDTDNQWAVGGWSMGGARYILITDSQSQTLTNKTINSPTINTPTLVTATHSGHLTMSGGYIFGSYINMTADVAGGTPAYVAGNNGDNYLRWWPASAVG